VLYAARRDWPEEPYLVTWLKRFGQCLEIPPQRLADGEFVMELRALLALSSRPAIEPSGAEQAADELASCLMGCLG
jgi:hypothetical protein